MSDYEHVDEPEVDLGKIVQSTFNQVIQDAVYQTIAGKVGRGVDDEVKQAIREKARDLCFKDPEIMEMIRESLVFWIRSYKR